ncbi:hypothetical protein ACFXAF_35865 [Kitasatospora sp. NPDC059463]|uniref:hypothetical protein n=1 Tax=Kitasatospora sp. NPDC059463 TaxID=3346842 RepID=UPI0036AA3CAB
MGEGEQSEARVEARTFTLAEPLAPRVVPHALLARGPDCLADLGELPGPGAKTAFGVVAVEPARVWRTRRRLSWRTTSAAAPGTGSPRRRPTDGVGRPRASCGAWWCTPGARGCARGAVRTRARVRQLASRLPVRCAEGPPAQGSWASEGPPAVRLDNRPWRRTATRMRRGSRRNVGEQAFSRTTLTMHSAGTVRACA